MQTKRHRIVRAAQQTVVEHLEYRQLLSAAVPAGYEYVQR